MSEIMPLGHFSFTKRHTYTSTLCAYYTLTIHALQLNFECADYTPPYEDDIWMRD